MYICRTFTLGEVRGGLDGPVVRGEDGIRPRAPLRVQRLGEPSRVQRLHEERERRVRIQSLPDCACGCRAGLSAKGLWVRVEGGTSQEKTRGTSDDFCCTLTLVLSESWETTCWRGRVYPCLFCLRVQGNVESEMHTFNLPTPRAGGSAPAAHQHCYNIHPTLVHHSVGFWPSTHSCTRTGWAAAEQYSNPRSLRRTLTARDRHAAQGTLINSA